MKHLPDMRSRREGGNPGAGESRNLEVQLQQSENATASRQAQHLQRLFAVSLSLATTISELAFAGGPR